MCQVTLKHTTKDKGYKTSHLKFRQDFFYFKIDITQKATLVSTEKMHSSSNKQDIGYRQRNPIILTSSVLTKFKVLRRLRRFPAEDKIVHDIPCLVTLCLTTPVK